MLIDMPPLPQAKGGSEANNKLLSGPGTALLLNREAAGQASLETTPERGQEGHCYTKGSAKQSPTATRGGCRGAEKPRTWQCHAHRKAKQSTVSFHQLHPTRKVISNTALMKQSFLCGQETALRSNSPIQAQEWNNAPLWRSP